MRKHTNGGGWECLWCVLHNITNNHTKYLYYVAKVKLLGVKVSLCVGKIPYYQLQDIDPFWKKMGQELCKNCVQEQSVQYINTL